jgi:uncharacterized membrane protein
MADRGGDSHVRSICKAVSWRMLGSFDTFTITLLVTGSFKAAGSIAGVETLSKIALFYLHERAWSKLRWGRADATTLQQAADAAVTSPSSSPMEAGGAPVAAGRLRSLLNVMNGRADAPSMGPAAGNFPRLPRMRHDAGLDQVSALRRAGRRLGAAPISAAAKPIESEVVTYSVLVPSPTQTSQRKATP